MTRNPTGTLLDRLTIRGRLTTMLRGATDGRVPGRRGEDDHRHLAR
ncbi:hypothetical protein [Microbispora triticiradicis]|nr:hypothetical protein [Microbispora triticiradicis]MBO4270831.1 hypothetical protein [Microbispora triticiradicis]